MQFQESLSSDPSQQAAGLPPPMNKPGASPLASPTGPDDWDQPPPRNGPSPWLIVLAIGGLALGGFGLVKSMVDPKPKVVQLSAPAQPSFFSEQSKMMREALDMAKEAQAMQREHMQMLQSEMQAAYEGEQFPTLVDEGGGGE